MSARYMKNQPKRANTVGFCKNPTHLGLVSENMLKQHGCLKKQCPYFKKYEDHRFWAKKEITKILKKTKDDDRICINGTVYKVKDINQLVDIYIRDYRDTGVKPVVTTADILNITKN